MAAFHNDSLSLEPSAQGCTGTASGTLEALREGDVIRRGAFTASLTCIPDHRPPVLTFRSLDTHPFGPHAVYISEPLTRGTTAQLQASGSPAVPLESIPARVSYPVTFESRDRALTFAKTYALVMEPPATDLAGNRATGPSPAVTTVADPGVMAEDGFEGPLNALTTTARVITDAEFVVIGGKRALVFPPTIPLVMTAAPRFTARLRVQPGESRLRLTARPFGLPNFSGSSVALRVAAPGGSIAQRSLPELGMTSSVDASRLRVGSPTVELGAATPFEIPLPAGVTNEVMVDIVVTDGCGLRPPTLGYIVDDASAAGPGCRRDFRTGHDEAKLTGDRRPEVVGAAPVPARARCRNLFVVRKQPEMATRSQMSLCKSLEPL